MRSLTEAALNNNRLVILLIITIIAGGIYVYLDYPKKEDPTIRIREAVVTASFPGMSTKRVEDLITRPIEETIRQIPQVKEIKSDSKTGSSVVHIIVKDEIKNMAPVWQDLRNKMADLKGKLPEGTQGPSVNDERGLTAVATIALWADGFTMAEMRAVVRTTRDRLYTVKGIKKVELFGIQEERIYLEVSNAKMAQLGLNPGTIVNTLTAQNIILPGGRLNAAGRVIVVEPSGNFNDVSEIASVLIAIPGTTKVVPLREIVKISRRYVEPPEKPVFFNGRPAIVLSVSMLDGVNAVEFGRRLTAKLKAIEGSLPFGYFLQYATFQPKLVEAAISNALGNVYQSLGIVLLVVMVFLGLRTGLIVGSFVPLAMLMGLIIMWTADIELQRMSIAAMIIALGMLVDNGIVIAEDIRARLERGEERRAAVIAAGRSLAIPLLTASLTTILAFAPIPLAVGGTGEYTLSLGQVVIIVLLSSWFLAMVSTTTLCYRFMHVKPVAAGPGGDPYGSRFYRVYRRMLEAMLRWRLAVIGLTLALLVLAGLGMQLVPATFFPANDSNRFLVYLDLPAGTHINKTTAEVRRLTAWLGDKTANPEVASTIAYVGSGGPRFFLSLSPLDPDPHVAFLLVTTRSNTQVPALIKRVRQRLFDRYPDVRGRVKAMWFGPTETGEVSIRISGPGTKHLTRAAADVMTALRAVPGTLDAKQDWENYIIKARVLVDQARARRAGITSQEVANSLAAYIDGAVISNYREGDKSIPLVVRGEPTERQVLTALRNVSVFSTSSGRIVPLTQIADVRAEWVLSRIKRYNQERTITVSAKNQTLTALQLLDKLRPTLAALKLPDGYRWEIGGELEKSKEAQANLFKNMPVCFALILALLVWQFGSFRRPAIILLTIPLTLIGAVIGLLVMRADFGFMVILGFLSLAGIIINNGIVLVDRIDIERDEGKDPYEAIVAASLARFRPILMTTMTTILGLTPLIVTVDPLFFGMAVVIAFGLFVATVFTLGVVPVLYALFFRVRGPAAQS